MNKINEMLFKLTTPDELDREIAIVKYQMNNTEDIVERRKLREELKELINIRNEDKKFKIGPKEILGAAVSFTGLALIMKHEEFNVLSSSERSWISRLFDK